jgi:hypothetical protein
MRLPSPNRCGSGPDTARSASDRHRRSPRGRDLRCARHSQAAKFTLAETTSGSSVGIPGTVGAILFGLIAAAAGAALFTGVALRWFAWLVAVGIVGVVLSFLFWQVSQAPIGLNVMPLGDVARSSLLLALPLILDRCLGCSANAPGSSTSPSRASSDGRFRRRVGGHGPPAASGPASWRRPLVA